GTLPVPATADLPKRLSYTWDGACKASNTEEPDAKNLHVGTCEGAAGQLAVLPRWPCANIKRAKENEMTVNPTSRPPFPPFTRETATQKVRMAEDVWNTRDPERVSLAYTVDSTWRNRAEFFSGREAIVQFLYRKWAKELDYRLIKELWAFHED